MKLYVIGDRETVLGFRLVGVEGRVAAERDAAMAALDSAVSRTDVGVVLVTETLAALIRDAIDARLYGMGFPLVLEIPGVSGPSADRLNVEDVVRKAIGVSI